MKSETDDLIQSLARDLGRKEPVVGLPVFMLRWGLASGGFLAVCMLAMPLRWDWHFRHVELRFWAETALWLLSACLAAALVYRSSIPSLLKKGDQKWGFLAIGALLTLLAIRVSGADVRAEWPGEMNYHRGWCGPLILIIGGLSGLGLFAWVRRAAPTNRGLTGLWAAVCAGCLGASEMQLVCAHDNALHVWLWHVTPVLILMGCGWGLAQLGLRWGGITAK
jgi:hypothetical protein